MKKSVHRYSDLVIEEPPRTGNHYSTFAFLEAQDVTIDVAHQFHAAAQLILAARLNIPGIALLRKHDQMAVSHLLYMHARGTCSTP
jgi:hypothetical protein